MAKLRLVRLVAAATGCLLAACAGLEGRDDAPARTLSVPPTQSQNRIVALADTLTIQTRVVQHTVTPGSVRDLPTVVEEQPRTVSMLMSGSLLGGLLKSEGEIAHSQFFGGDVRETADSRHRLMRVGLNGGQGPFRYGAAFRSAGDAFYGQQDQAAREVWGEWGTGLVRLRTTVGERWDNINRDPSRPRITALEERASLSLVPVNWPQVMISYVHGTSTSSLEPAGTAPIRNLSDALEAAVSLARGRWDARLFTNYALVTDRQVMNGSIGVTHGMQATYRPTARLSLTPAVTLREDQQRWSGVQTETPTASLSLVYEPRKTLKLTAFGLYSRAHSSDGLINTSTYRLKSVFTWTSFETAGWATTISLDAGYTALLDGVDPGRSNEDLSGLVRLQLVGL